MSSLTASTSSAKSFDDIRKTAKQNAYSIENQEDFIELYFNDPFFKQKVDCKIEQANKRILKNPILATVVPSMKDVTNISSKLNKAMGDHEFVEQCLFYKSLIEKSTKK